MQIIIVYPGLPPAHTTHPTLVAAYRRRVNRASQLMNLLVAAGNLASLHAYDSEVGGILPPLSSAASATIVIDGSRDDELALLRRGLLVVSVRFESQNGSGEFAGLPTYVRVSAADSQGEMLNLLRTLVARFEENLKARGLTSLTLEAPRAPQPAAVGAS